MESESSLHADGPDGAEVSPLAENQAADTIDDLSENNVSSHEDASAAVDESATIADPTSSSDVLHPELQIALAEVDEQSLLEPEPVNAEGDEEMDIDEVAASAAADAADAVDAAVADASDASAYIGDNCLSTPAETEDGSPQDNESQLDPMMKEDDEEGLDGAAEESPDQSISSGMPTDNESSTMDEDMGGGEGVASSDDVNDISSAAQEALSTGIR
ncbi:Host cell factor 1 [Operophtera brumata]|uniref:Host cell factor 1 n=1 Tax=Operophtera brumata TaxID=104452 RepID=A0A0L7L3L1_OPEBR|nr:Host cell factor 1 [Operophtera brumata]